MHLPEQEYTRLEFKRINNDAKYGGFIAGLRVAKKLGIKSVNPCMFPLDLFRRKDKILSNDDLKGMLKKPCDFVARPLYFIDTGQK